MSGKNNRALLLIAAIAVSLVGVATGFVMSIAGVPAAINAAVFATFFMAALLLLVRLGMFFLRR